MYRVTLRLLTDAATIIPLAGRLAAVERVLIASDTSDWLTRSFELTVQRSHFRRRDGIIRWSRRTPGYHWVLLDATGAERRRRRSAPARIYR